MAYPYRLNRKAHEEYINAYEWYEERRSGLGDRFMQKTEERLLQISNHPEYFGKRNGNFREVKVEDFPYIIVYEFFKRKQIIHITAIYHHKRNPLKKYRKMR